MRDRFNETPTSVCVEHQTLKEEHQPKQTNLSFKKIYIVIKSQPHKHIN